ncbi:MAG: type II 3-dehydroquinate dehydratase [Micrococcaceae bacterium]
MNIMILNGPNLNKLGTREPSIYGSETLEDIKTELEKENGKLDFRQTNSEAQMIDWVHEALDSNSHIIMNPAAFTHYSYALADACAMLKDKNLKLIEIHLSNPHAREDFRRNSVISPVATGTIAGFGKDSYRLALNLLHNKL